MRPQVLALAFRSDVHGQKPGGFAFVRAHVYFPIVKKMAFPGTVLVVGQPTLRRYKHFHDPWPSHAIEWGRVGITSASGMQWVVNGFQLKSGARFNYVFPVSHDGSVFLAYFNSYYKFLIDDDILGCFGEFYNFVERSKCQFKIPVDQMGDWLDAH